MAPDPETSLSLLVHSTRRSKAFTSLTLSQQYGILVKYSTASYRAYFHDSKINCSTNLFPGCISFSLCFIVTFYLDPHDTRFVYDILDISTIFPNNFCWNRIYHQQYLGFNVDKHIRLQVYLKLKLSLPRTNFNLFTISQDANFRLYQVSNRSLH